MRWLADENFNNDIFRGILRRKEGFDMMRVQDVGLSGQDDEAVLAWAAAEKRLLLTHDVTTITNCAYRRIEQDLPMPGVFEIAIGAAVGVIIADLLLIDECSTPGEWAGRIVYLPFRP